MEPGPVANWQWKFGQRPGFIYFVNGVVQANQNFLRNYVVPSLPQLVHHFSSTLTHLRDEKKENEFSTNIAL